MIVVASTSSAATATGSPSLPDVDVVADVPTQFKNEQIPTRPIKDVRLSLFDYLKKRCDELTGY